MSKLTWEYHLKRYRDEAWDYYSNRTNIVPTPEEILEYVCECIEDNSGVEVDDEQYFSIAKILGIDLD